MKVWLAKPSQEEKSQIISSLLSGTTPATTTTEEITSKLQWTCTCGSLLSNIRTSSTVSVKYNIHAGMLQWFTQPAVPQRITAGDPPVSANAIYLTAESLPDEAVDADLRHLRTCFSEVAWVLVTSIRNLIHGYQYCMFIHKVLNYMKHHLSTQCLSNRGSGNVKPVPL